MAKAKMKNVENIKLFVKTLRDYEIVKSDSRIGGKIALATKEDGCLRVRTDYMTYDEMYYFMRGVYMKENNYI